MKEDSGTITAVFREDGIALRKTTGKGEIPFSSRAKPAHFPTL
jgi:hypothetical protein